MQYPLPEKQPHRETVLLFLGATQKEAFQHLIEQNTCSFEITPL